MEDAIAEESHQRLAASIGGGGPAEPTLTEVLPAQPSALPTLARSQISSAGPVTEPSVTNESQRRILDAPHKTGNGSLHHTLLPRTMVIAGLLGALASPAVAFALERQGHLELNGTNWYFDQRGRAVASAVVVAVVACSVLGWLWWTAAAALNARQQARYTISPFFAPLLIVVMSGCGLLLVGTVRTHTYGDDERTRKTLVVAALIAIAVISHFVILEAYRRVAGVIGGVQRPWLLVIGLPWVTLAANLLAQFFAQTVGDSYLKVSALGNMVVCGVQVLALYQAMSSFDRACSGRQMAHTERGELPDFMRSH